MNSPRRTARAWPHRIALILFLLPCAGIFLRREPKPVVESETPAPECHEFYPRVIVDSGGQPSCRVTIYSPDQGAPGLVQVYWDGKEIFSGRLPVIRSKKALTGMPCRLLEIHTSPGSHILEVRHKEEAVKVTVVVKEHGRHVYELFSWQDRRQELIHELGPNEFFA